MLARCLVYTTDYYMIISSEKLCYTNMANCYDHNEQAMIWLLEVIRLLLVISLLEVIRLLEMKCVSSKL